jgi:hypothetical protein
MADVVNIEEQRRAATLNAVRASGAQKPEPEKPPLKRMSVGLLISSLLLTLIQVAVTWFTGDTLGLILTIPISIGLYFMLRPYRKSMGQGVWLANKLALIFDSVFDFIPIDIVTIIWAFVSSRSKLIQKVTHHGGGESTAQEDTEKQKAA